MFVQLSNKQLVNISVMAGTSIVSSESKLRCYFDRVMSIADKKIQYRPNHRLFARRIYFPRRAYSYSYYFYTYFILTFLHELPFSKTKINSVIHHSHNGLVTITKSKIYLRLFLQGIVFDLFSTHQIHFQLFFEVKKRGQFPNA